jgi:phospholipase C
MRAVKITVKNLSAAIVAASIVLTAGCSSWSAPASGVSDSVPRTLDRLTRGGPIQHVIVIVQENRTVDNLFNGFPGANTVRYGKTIRGKTVLLQPISLTAPYDISHRHSAWVGDYNNGNMDGFNTEGENCYQPGQCPQRKVAAYGYVPQAETKPYWRMAERYTFADDLFQSNQGPSFPAHQYIVSGTSTISNGSKYRAAENPIDPQHKGRQGGCNSLRDTTVAAIDPAGRETKAVYPCFDRDSIMKLLNAKYVSWHYYQEFHGSGEWHAVDAVRGIWDGPSYENVVWPSSQVLKDISSGRLADVSFVTPSVAESDHAGKNNGTGPAWVASIVNAVGRSPYWKSTAVIVIWDDWGGWYDHVKPPVYNSYELGFRVPMIVISPYAKVGYVSHVQYEFGSILKFIEETFDLGSLGTTDVRANDLTDCFNFAAKPRAFVPIPANYSAKYFESLPINDESPDDDY